MSDEENEDEEPQSWADWIEDSLAMLIAGAVIGASLLVPLGLWIATSWFGWEPPEFVQEWIDFFSA